MDEILTTAGQSPNATVSRSGIISPRYFTNNIAIVANTGAAFSAVQDAIDAITDAASDNKYSVAIYPGIYTENVVNTAYISLIGMGGSRGSCEITAASGTVLTVATGSNCVYRNIKIKATGTAEAINIPVGMGTNWVQFWNCSIECAYGAHNDDLITMNSGHLQIINSVINYTATGGSGTHRLLYVAGASTQIYIVNSWITVDIDDTGSNDFTAIELVSGANCDVMIAMNSIGIDNEMTGGTSCFYKDLDTIGTACRRVSSNPCIRMQGATGATGTAFILDNVATTLESSGNTIVVEDFNYNFACNIGAAATWNTTFDYMTVDPEIYTGTGTINELHTHEPGVLHISSIDLANHLSALKDLGALAAGETETLFDIIIEAGITTGGSCNVIDVAVGGDSGNTDIVAIGTHAGIDPVRQRIGTPASLGKAWSVDSSVWTDRTAAFNAAGTDVEIFPDDNDQIYIGSASQFDEIPIALETPASQDVLPTFEYWSGAWTSFTPADDTNGFRNDGIIRFNGSDLTGWVTTQVNGEGDGPWYYIRITRTRNFIVTPPTEDTIAVTSTTAGDYRWNSSGILNINAVRPTVNTNNVDNPPTQAQLQTAFGASEGFSQGDIVGVIDDNDDNTNLWLVVSDGQANGYHYVGLTKGA